MKARKRRLVTILRGTMNVKAIREHKRNEESEREQREDEDDGDGNGGEGRQ